MTIRANEVDCARLARQVADSIAARCDNDAARAVVAQAILTGLNQALAADEQDLGALAVRIGLAALARANQIEEQGG